MDNEANHQYEILKYKLANRALQTALWDMDVIDGDPINPNNVVIWSDELRQMLGFKDENYFPTKLNSWSDRLHPEDMQPAQDAFAKHLTDHTGSTPFSVECRLKLKNGKYRHFQAIGDTMRNADGAPLRVAGMLRDIHDEKLRIEEDRRAQDHSNLQLAKLDLVVKASKVGLLDMEVLADDPINPSNVFNWSTQFRHLLGFSDENDFPNVLSSWSNRLHPEDKEKTLDALLSHLLDKTGKTPFDVECRLQRKNGEYGYFMTYAETIRDEGGNAIRLAGALRDISEVKKNAFEMAKQKADAIERAHWYESILHATPLPITVTDQDMKWTFVNKAVEDFLGTKLEDMLGKPCSNWNADICNTPDCGIACAKRGLKRTYFTHAGSYYQVDVEILKKMDGGIAGFIEVVQDITEVKEIDKIKELTEKALASSKAKSQFLAAMSHEIRTPMNAIVGMTELALREDNLEAAREHLFTVKQSSENLLSIINDILDLSKIETGKMQIVPAHYLFASMLNDAISIIRIRAMDLGIQFIVNLDSNIPNNLIGDETRVRQVLINILGNAVKYTEKGFVSFSVYGEAADENTINLTMEIKDSGKGIKQEHLESLFEEYVQVDMEKNKGTEGVGLGLTIANSLITAMGGSIAVESEYGKGSLFTIRFPQAIQSPEKMAVVESPNSKNVVLFENRRMYADSIIRTIENLGAECALAETDTDFLEKLLRNSYSFIFISHALFEKNKDAIIRFAINSQVVLLTELGESAPEGSWSTISMPVHALSVAHILNGTSDGFSYSEESSVRFSAPEARILVVDDIETNLKVAEGLLIPYKMKVDLCKSGFEAIEAVKSECYDVVFMDHRMPEMDGVEATQHIRNLDSNDSYYQSSPIIALTANAVAGVKEMFLENGFSDFLSKPIDIAKLNSILEKWIPREKQKRISTESTKSARLAKAPKISVEIPGLDTGKGIALSGGSVELYFRALAAFRDDGMDKSEKIRASLEASNLRLYATFVHGIKSAAANIGATNLSEAAYQLEMAGSQEDLNYINSHNGDFLIALSAILDAVKNALDSQNQNKKSINAELFHSELIKLKEALGAMNAGAINNALDCLQKLAWGDKIANNISEISMKVLLVEYEEAEELIDSLLPQFSPGATMSTDSVC
jgi:PAS domain S-box-containing protein